MTPFEKILGVSTLLIGISTILVSVNQTLLQRRALQLEKSKERPNFTIDHTFLPPGNYEDVKDHWIKVYANLNHIETLKITKTDYIRLEYGQNSYLLPFHHYWGFCTDQRKPSSEEIFWCYGQNNSEIYVTIHKRIVKKLNNGGVSPFYTGGIATIFKFDYVTKSGEKYIQYQESDSRKNNSQKELAEKFESIKFLENKFVSVKPSTTAIEVAATMKKIFDLKYEIDDNLIREIDDAIEELSL